MFLVATAHLSAKSCEDVKRTIMAVCEALRLGSMSFQLSICYWPLDTGFPIKLRNPLKNHQ